ncbi:hypothetical protein K1T71_007354 [Dendrolimus kikuchii]|uniref:Uncharacterized protein n=1 Tax=Dendrolimus kikuchii TaxID=765133 RepID=A0ACC1D0C7_9NEOP|nr:hypothetical protein K1T71_007354 [Dendrolimus kikuchii]
MSLADNKSWSSVSLYKIVQTLTEILVNNVGVNVCCYLWDHLPLNTLPNEHSDLSPCMAMKRSLFLGSICE